MDIVINTLLPEVLNKYKTDNFIEFGTYKGNGCKLAHYIGFKNIHSIEKDEFYYNLNTVSLRRFKNIHLYKGSTLNVLPKLLKNINEKSTFWIDSHNENDCPVLKELEILSKHKIKNHVLLIDDMRIFGTVTHEFITVNKIIKAIMKINPDYQISYEPSPCGPSDIMVAQVP
jgi:hypothetical protein